MIDHVKGTISRWLAMDWALDCTDRNLTSLTISNYLAFLLGCGGYSNKLLFFHKGRRFNISIKIEEIEKEQKKVMKKFEDLKGKILLNIENVDNFELIFTLAAGKYALNHDQDCCEDVRIVDINGNLDDLIGTPILLAEEVISDNKNPEGIDPPIYLDSFTWTFYKLATIKGYVTIRWLGESNGYYSEHVSFGKFAEKVSK